jgi:phosphate transport system protein
MQTHFEKQLADLKEKLLTMASHAESAVTRAVEAVVTRDPELAQRVKADDEVIDRFEVEIDELAIQCLAKAPLASDLRLVTIAMKLSQNLERVGDEASKIAKRARDLSQEPPLKLDIDIARMTKLALGMLKGSLDAFVTQDSAAARALVPRDKEIDALNKEIHRQLVQEMRSSAESITRCLNLMVVAKSLERIADHGKNVAEEVVYLCEAQDIRHAAQFQARPPAEPAAATRPA